jgi:molybdopterin-containing oxidoreductase family iron-sulfur binding subunit
MKRKNGKETTRRDFFKKSITVAAGTLLTSSFLSSCSDETKEAKGEKIKLLTPQGKLVEVDKSNCHECPAVGQEAREGLPNKKMVMVIDLARCANARKCLQGCQKMHHLPPHVAWIKFFLMRDSQDTDPYWFPKPCFQCNNPPCVKVCPVGATFKRTDGIVLIDNERCIGCKFCMAACPYSSRVFNWTEPNVDDEGNKVTYSPETSNPGKVGTVGKCDFCPDMVRLGKLPSCVLSCPNGVYYYGDKNEDTVTNGTETVRFSELIQQHSAYRFMEELGTEPGVYYLPPTNRLFDYKVGFDELSKEEIDLYKKEVNIKD